MTDKPSNDLVAKYHNALRKAAGGPQGYNCYLCNETFQASPKLWAHAKNAHHDSPDITDFENEAEARAQFCERAKVRYRATSTKDATDPLSKPHVKANSTPTYIAGDTEHGKQDRRQSPPGKYGNQNRPTLSGDAMPERGAPPKGHNSLVQPKSPPSPTLPSDKYKVDSRTRRTRHGAQLSGGDIHTNVSEASRQQAPGDRSPLREGLGQRKLLFDPHTDPISGQGSGWDHDQGFNRSGTRLQPLSDHLSPQKESKSYNMEGWQSEPKLTRDRPLKQEPLDSLVETSNGNLERGRPPSRGASPSVDELSGENPEAQPEMLLQPETRPISHDQLVIEVKGIYAGLVMVEAKCIDIDEKQTAAAQEKDLTKRIQLKNDQWQSLIALHKQLLHEHHDFFLASQHPAASPALSRLAAKYSMPARMWRHGIHAFLEVLRHRLPESLEHMLAFIYIAYSMMALLYETVPAFEDTWIECLGDLGRYRMAIEDDEPRDRETWSNVARFWYNKAADQTPTIGRLYHHLAILARPYSLEQLSLYTRSLTCVSPFESARGSIMTMFNPVLKGNDVVPRRSPSVETIFIRAHGLLYTIQHADTNDQFLTTVNELAKDGLWDRFITKSSTKFKETGVYAAASNIAAIFEYGNTKQGGLRPILRIIYEDASRLREKVFGASADQGMHSGNVKAVKAAPKTAVGLSDQDNENLVLSQESSVSTFMSQALKLTSTVLDISLKRTRDSNVQPLVNVYLAFLWSLILVQETCKYFERTVVWRLIERHIPWFALCLYLSELAQDYPTMTDNIYSEEFPKSDSRKSRPLLEDFVLRGQLYAIWLFPPAWFTDTMVDDDERTHDPPSMVHARVGRILWLGHRIASADRWIRYDSVTKRFEVTDYISDVLAVQSRTSTASRDEDSVMTYDEVQGIYTPRTESIAPSDLHDSVTEYTPQSESVAASESNEDPGDSSLAPTPMDLDKSDVLGPITSKSAELSNSIEDSPMVDLSPGKSQRPAERNISGWAQSSFLDIDSSSALAKDRDEGYLPEREQIEGLVGDQSHEDAETYKP